MKMKKTLKEISEENEKILSVLQELMKDFDCNDCGSRETRLIADKIHKYEELQRKILECECEINRIKHIAINEMKEDLFNFALENNIETV